jgi:predicted RNA binding protein YcfA (HicA-like mRNA interferase family)
MSFLPVISGKDAVKALLKYGFYLKRQRGSHIILRKDEPFCQVVVPNHKILDRGTLINILKSTGLSVDEFKELCR